MTQNSPSQDLPDTFPAECTPSSQRLTWSSHDITARVWGRLYPVKQQYKSLEMIKDEYRIGRAPACDLMVGDEFSANVLGAISKEHCAIRRVQLSSHLTDFVIYLEDKSFNGTFVNGIKVGKGNSVILENNNIISLAFRHVEVFVYIDAKLDSENTYPEEIRNRFAISRTLGTGAYGEVKLVFDKNSSKSYAMKIIQKKKVLLANRRVVDPVKIEREINILKSLKHPCIVGFEEAFDTPDMVCIVLEYVGGGELFNSVSNRTLKENEAKLYFYQLVQAVKYLHNHNIIHRDIKLENILLAHKQPDTLIKLTDFGLSKFVDSESLLTFCGTPLYIAPEILKTSGKMRAYDKRVDIWSLGIVLYMCLGGYPPFSSIKDNKPLPQQILEADFSFPTKYWKNISKSAIDLIRRMLVVDPNQRITVHDILKHQWLQDRAMRMKFNRLIKTETFQNVNDENVISDSDSDEAVCNVKRFRADFPTVGNNGASSA